jgi:membrane-bound ClpP family serine protease
MLDRIGIPGIIGAIVLLVWLVGWLFFGKHDGYWHVLFLIGTLLCIAQGVRRVHA